MKLSSPDLKTIPQTARARLPLDRLRGLAAWLDLARQRLDWLFFPLAIFVGSRLAIFAGGIIGDRMLPTEEGHWVADPDSPFLSLWAKWDSQFYVKIAREGYWYVPGEQGGVAFFPLYPLLMRLVGEVVEGRLVLAGFLVSNLAFFGVLVILYQLAALELGDRAAARRTVFYLAIVPTTFYFNSVYTESLFLLLTLAAIYAARRGWWGAAALAGLLAAGTRNLGVVTWGLVMWAWLRHYGWTLDRIHTRAAWRALGQALRHHGYEVLILGAIPLGLVAYMFFLREQFGDPFAFIAVQAAWNRENIGPWAVLLREINAIVGAELNKSYLYRASNLTVMLGVLAMTPWIWRRLGAGYAIYVLICILVPTASALQSVTRYLLTLFPVFILLGAWGRSVVFDRLITLVFAILLGVWLTVWVNWIFVA